jgi:type I restriction enzyme S subunit
MARDAPIEHDLRWPVVTLAEIVTKIGSGATPKGGADAYLPSRARFALVRSQNVFDRRFDHDGLAFISDQQADGLRSVVLQPDDILLNITGDGITFARACMVPKDVLPACVNQHVSIIRLDSQRADPGYVLAFLTHPEVKSYMESFNAGGSRRAITKGHIESFRLPLPPLPEQRAIAHILGTLDDKIGLNRRMNDTLEAMARALFKSWFVDLELIRTKTADLIREGVLEIGDGYRAKNSELGATGLPFLRAGNLNAGFDTANADVLLEKSVAKAGSKISRVGDIAFTSKGTIGRFARVTQGTPQFVYSPQVCYWRSLQPSKLQPIILYCWMLSDDLKEQIDAVAGQTDMALYVSLQDQRRMSMPTFPSSQNVIARRMEPLFARQSSITSETKTLAALRNTLLPKLISGELRVKDAEKIAAKAL